LSGHFDFEFHPEEFATKLILNKKNPKAKLQLIEEQETKKNKNVKRKVNERTR